MKRNYTSIETSCKGLTIGIVPTCEIKHGNIEMRQETRWRVDGRIDKEFSTVQPMVGIPSLHYIHDILASDTIAVRLHHQPGSQGHRRDNCSLCLLRDTLGQRPHLQVEDP